MTNYVIMKYGKDSDRYGQPLRVDSIDEERHSKQEIIKLIEKWGDEKSRPVLIKDPLMISVFDELTRRNALKSVELDEMKNRLKSIAEEIEQLAY